VKLGYDPTEGVIRMELSTADPATSRRFSEQLIEYAEERVDALVEAVDPPVEGYLLDMSRRGARVVLRTTEAIGDVVTLMVRAGERSSISHCRVRWRRQYDDRCLLGVEFGR